MFVSLQKKKVEVRLRQTESRVAGVQRGVQRRLPGLPQKKEKEKKSV